ncbi:uncharacterized protein LOC111810699 [Cucurbita pepo subsp. pepo]|uniref:uncharacterized protein LOC111810699 n=1 Tax=Cucurbita pepo subsp. pepo TaxID=3664 RepID=UPI000C9D612F|nr:uncharacterized protein LOC111810699 [Cucurbita pepo subsp. pepo]
MGRVLYGWAMVLVSPAKISCFNGLLHPTFCPFPSRVTFVNCNLTLSVGYRSNPIVAEYVCLDPVAEFVVIETQRFKEQVSEKLAKDRETIVEADDEGKTVCFITKILQYSVNFIDIFVAIQMTYFSQYMNHSGAVVLH